MEKDVIFKSGFGSFKKKRGYNEWGIWRKDYADCVFPSEIRIEELGHRILGTDDIKESYRFVGSELIGKNMLLLKILPYTDRKKIRELIEAVEKETK
jgi:hypothetical protein